MIGKFNNQGVIVPLSGDVDYQTVLNALMPVGYTYVQYPQTDSPEVLWPGFTWQEQNYDGAFFRSSGAGANGYATCTDTLANCLQSYQNAYHNHQVCDHSHSASTNSTGEGYFSFAFNACYGTAIPVRSTGGAFRIDATGSTYQNTCNYATFENLGCSVHLNPHSHTVTGGGVCGTLPDTSYNGSSTNTEARPKNYTVKVWKRIA